MRPSTDRADVVIVGAGIIGLAIAYELGRRGRRVRVVDKDLPGRGATWASAGMLAPISEADVDSPVKIEFGLESLRRYPGFVAGVEAASGRACGYRPDGTLWVAVNRDEREELEHLEATLRSKSLRARWLGTRELLLEEPHLSARVVAGLRVVEDHQLDPRALCGALEVAVAKQGGDIRSRTEALEIGARAGRAGSVALRGPDGEPIRVECETIVLATGAWAGVSPRLPVELPAVRPVKGQIVRLSGPSLLRSVIRSPEVYLVPRAGGDLLLGSTMEEQGFDTSPTAGAVHDLLRHAWQILPGLYDLRVEELSAGLRPAARDHLPVIGATELPGLYVATGHFRSGILLAPATAELLADYITTGQPPEALRPFAPGRFVERPGAVESGESRDVGA